VSSLLRRFGKLNETLVRLYTRQILTGLAYLHAHGVVHRDVKVGNAEYYGTCRDWGWCAVVYSCCTIRYYVAVHRIVMQGANILVDRSGETKLADFGASRNISEKDAAATAGAQSLRGTPPFMAPEAIRQSAVGRKSDIWSLGCTVIEMCTGRPPWGQYADNPMAMM
jgi:mitogen-activated protein kinase kinase kinase ANP1